MVVFKITSWMPNSLVMCAGDCYTIYSPYCGTCQAHFDDMASTPHAANPQIISNNKKSRLCLCFLVYG